MERKLNFPMLIFVLLMSPLQSLSQLPAIKFRMNPGGVKILNNVGFREVPTAQGTKVKFLTGAVEVGAGIKLSYNFTDNVVENFEFIGNTTTHAISPNIVLVIGRDAFVRIKENRMLKVLRDGAELQSSSVGYEYIEFLSTVAVVYELSVKDGSLQLHDVDCFHRTGVFHLTVDVDVPQEQGAPFDPVENDLKSHLVQQVCRTFVPQVTAQINKNFVQAPPYLDILQVSRISFALLPGQLEVVDNSYVSINASGRVYPIGKPDVEYPYPIGDFPEFSNTSRMAQALISDYVIRALLHSFGDLKAFDFVYSDSSIPEFSSVTIRSYLALVADSFREYKDRPLTIATRLSDDLVFEVDEVDVKLKGRFNVSLMSNLVTGKTFEALIADANFTANGDVTTVGNALVIAFDDVSIDLRLIKSNIGSFEFQILDALIRSTLPELLKTSFNDILRTGIIFSRFLTMDFYNVIVLKRKNALEIFTDLRID